MKKSIVLLTFVLLLFLTSCSETTEVEVLDCLEGFKQVGDKCVEDPDYVDVTACHGSYYQYDEDSIVFDQLVFSDEFDGDELDRDKWNVSDTSYGGGNNELQYYKDDSDNVYVSDGTLKLTALYESFGNRSYTSGKIDSRYNFTFRYGRVEVRAKHPVGKGTWSAAWMMPALSSYGGWPRSGEIDITEFVGYDPTKTHSTIHTYLYNHKNGTQRGGAKTIDNLSSEFHVYVLEWFPESINFYVDDQFVFRFSPGTYQTCPSDEQWPFDKDFYLILNLAIGGDWGGAQGVDDTIFPTTFEIDYVRVYQSTELEDIKQELDPS